MLPQITLKGRLVHLDPLRPRHVEDLWPAADDERVWRPVAAQVETKEDLADWVDARLSQVHDGTAQAFIQRRADTGEAIGATTLYDVDLGHRTMEIGHTWLSPKVWGTAVNTEAKLLLLDHAFDTLEALRVQLKADARNKRSQRAIEKLGATREGTLRNVQRLPDGQPRDMVHYSILDTEWPRVKGLLLERLEETLATSQDAPVTERTLRPLVAPRPRAAATSHRTPTGHR